jgi:hypothetical protein
MNAGANEVLKWLNTESTMTWKIVTALWSLGCLAYAVWTWIR